MFRRFFAWMSKYERHLSALAMIAGFVADNIAFKRIDLIQTQLLFLVYTVTCLVAIPWLHYIESRAEVGYPRPR